MLSIDPVRNKAHMSRKQGRLGFCSLVRLAKDAQASPAEFGCTVSITLRSRLFQDVFKFVDTELVSVIQVACQGLSPALPRRNILLAKVPHHVAEHLCAAGFLLRRLELADV